MKNKKRLFCGFCVVLIMFALFSLPSCQQNGSPLGDPMAESQPIELPPSVSVDASVPSSGTGGTFSSAVMGFEFEYPTGYIYYAELGKKIIRPAKTKDSISGLMINDTISAFKETDFTEIALRSQLDSTGNVTDYGTYAVKEINGINVYSMGGIITSDGDEENEKIQTAYKYFMFSTGTRSTMFVATANGASLSVLKDYDKMVDTIKKIS